MGLWEEKHDCFYTISVSCGGHRSDGGKWLFSPPMPSWWCQQKWDVVSVVDFEVWSSDCDLHEDCGEGWGGSGVRERERDCCNSSEWDIETHWAKKLFCQGFYLGMRLKWQPVSQFPLPALSCTGGVCIRPHAGGKARAPVSEHSQDVEINSSSEQKKTDKNLNGILFCSVCIPYCRRDGTVCDIKSGCRIVFNALLCFLMPVVKKWHPSALKQPSLVI